MAKYCTGLSLDPYVLQLHKKYSCVSHKIMAFNYPRLTMCLFSHLYERREMPHISRLYARHLSYSYRAHIEIRLQLSFISHDKLKRYTYGFKYKWLRNVCDINLFIHKHFKTSPRPLPKFTFFCWNFYFLSLIMVTSFWILESFPWKYHNF